MAKKAIITMKAHFSSASGGALGLMITCCSSFTKNRIIMRTRSQVPQCHRWPSDRRSYDVQ